MFGHRHRAGGVESGGSLGTGALRGRLKHVGGVGGGKAFVLGVEAAEGFV